MRKSVLKRRLLSGGIWVFTGKIITSLTGLLVNALLARLLSPNELGVYFLVFSVVAIGALLGEMGLQIAIVRFVAESIGMNRFNRARHVVGVVLRTGMVGAVVAGSAYYLFIGDFIAIKVFHSPAMVALSGLVAGWIIVVTMQGLIVETFRGFHDIRLATIFGGMVGSILYLLCLILLWCGYGQSSLSTILLLSFGSGAISTLIAGWLLRTRVVNLPVEDGSQPLKYKIIFSVAWPLFVVSLTQFVLRQSDIWIVGAFLPKEEVALYGASLRLVNMVALPLLLANLVVPPFIAEMYVKGKKQELEQALRTTATIAGIPAFILLLCFIVGGGPILSFIYGQPYRSGFVVLAILSTGQLFNVFAGSCGMMLVHTGHQVIMMIINIISGLLSVIIGMFAVTQYGIVGLACVFAAMLVVQNIFMLYYAKNKTGVFTAIKLSFS